MASRSLEQETVDLSEFGLTAKQDMFCRELILDFNATRAAIAAGYSEKGARTEGARLLAKANIQAAVAALTTPRLVGLELSVERLDREVARIAYFNLGRILHVTGEGDPFIDLSKATEDDMAALQAAEIEDFTVGRGEDAREVRRVKVRAHDKIAAITLGLKRLGKLVDKTEATVGLDFGMLMEAAERRAGK